MKNKTLLFTLFLTVFAFGLFLNWPNSSLKATIASHDVCQILFPDCQECVKKENNGLMFYQAFKNNKNIGTLFYTKDISPEIKGYAGHINLLVGLDNNKITGLKLISHSETDQFVYKFDDFLKQFSNKSLKDNFIPGKDIDVMTQATTSSTAVAESIKQSINKLLKASPETKPFKTFSSRALSEIIIALLIYTLAVLAFIKHNLIFRWISLALGLIYLGVIKATMFSIINIANIGLFKTPDFLSNPLLIIITFLTIIVVILFGNIYCSSVCPYASLQEILLRAFKKLLFCRMNPSAKLADKSSWGGIIILFSTLITAFVMGTSNHISFETFVILFSRRLTLINTIFISLTLILNIFHPRFWCRYLCPAGALLNIIPSFRDKKIAKFNNNNVGEPTQNCHKTNNVIFIISLITCYLLIVLIFKNSFIIKANPDSTPSPTSETKLLAQENNITYTESDKLKKNLKDAGINPYPAKYWKEAEQ